MDTFLTSIGMCMMNCILVSFIMGYFYIKNKEKFLLFWSIGWFLFGVRCLVEVLFVLIIHEPIILHIAGLFAWSSALMIFLGVLQYNNFKLKAQYIIISAIFYIVLISLHFMGSNLDVYVLSYTICFLIWATSYNIVRHFKESIIGKYLAVIGYGLFGLAFLFNPNQWVVESNGEIVYEFISFVVMLSAIGFIVIYFEKMYLKIASENEKLIRMKSEVDKYKGLADNVSDIVIFVEKNGKILEVNQAAINKYGYTQKEMQQMSIYQLRQSDPHEEVALQMIMAFNTGILFEAKHFTKEGLPIDVEVSAASMQVDGREVLVSIVRDISERKKNEKMLKKLLSAVEQSSSVIVITDPQGQIEYVNPKFTTVTGYEEKEVIGKNPRILKSGKQDATLYKTMWKTILSGSEWKGELVDKKKSGETYWAILNISPVKDHKGNIVNFIAIQEDISELKFLQEKYYESNQESLRFLNELKQMQSRLIQQEKIAGIGQLAAGVAHEINNPLGYVSSNIEMIKKYTDRIIELERMRQKFMASYPDITIEMSRVVTSKKLEDILSDFPEIISETQNGIERIKNIVKSLKNFSRIELVESFSPFKLNESILDTLVVLSNELKFKFQIEKNLGDIPIIQANGGQINQVIMNLIMNAKQAIESNTSVEMGIIKISTLKIPGFITCTVEDNGIGVPLHLRDRIFEPFFTTKQVGEGTGLGLGIVYDIIVNKHQGKISVDESDLGGAMFKFSLPCNEILSNEEHNN